MSAQATDLGYSKSEIMIAASARQLAGERNCFVGIGLPNIVCSLAQHTVSPGLQLVYESGVFGARPERLPLSIGDPTLVSGSTAVIPRPRRSSAILPGIIGYSRPLAIRRASAA